MTPTRRAFLKSTAAITAAAPFVLGAGESKSETRYTAALVGCGWWGTNILCAALADGRIRVVGLCDVDQSQLDQCAAKIAPLTSDAPKRYTDYREMFDREKPAIVIVATPDHW